MTTVLILHIELDGGTEAEVAEYGRDLVMSFEERRTHSPQSIVTVDARAEQVRHISVETQ
jgi:hypothetical protein